ncbi:glycosyltransferase [Methylorubrum aminovorans]|uniref:glycosyltransferase n=1 Tax=Methylorubrum aminovorans TaxID=269069 RepID=UPI003C2EFC58
MKAIVFVTPELSPFTAGGIGRVVYNIISEMSQADRDRTFIVGIGFQFTEQQVQKFLPGVRLINVSDHPEGATGFDLPSWAFSNTIWHWRSLQILKTLKRLVAVGTLIDYIEFPDWGGLAFCTTQEKLLSGFLAESTIAVRLHSSTAVLLRHEDNVPSLDALCQIDLERKALIDCNMIVGQLESSAETTKEVLKISDEEWLGRFYLHSPPVIIDRPLAANVTPIDVSQNILFTSKIQPLKAPDVFIRGVAGFMTENPDYIGKAILCAHNFDKELHKKLERLIPSHLAERFEFDSNVSGSFRDALISRSVVVITSRIESYCLAAYEASLMGARLIVNGGNDAFGITTPWHDGLNCYKFDGTAHSLTSALSKNFRSRDDLRPVRVNRHKEPWKVAAEKLSSRKISDKILSAERAPLVSFVVSHFNMGRHLPETLHNIFQQTYDNLEVIVVDDGSSDKFSVDLIDRIAQSYQARLRVIKLSGNVGLAAARNVGIASARGEFIVTLDADDLIRRDFVSIGVRALLRETKFDVLVPQTAFFRDMSDIALNQDNIEFVDYAVFVGEAFASGIVANRYSTATALFRASIFDKYLYNHELKMYEDWNLYQRLSASGVRFLVTNDIMFFYRRRQNSMITKSRSIVDNQREKVDLFRDKIDGANLHPLSMYGVSYLLSRNELADRLSDELHALRQTGVSGVQSDHEKQMLSMEDILDENALMKEMLAASGSSIQVGRRWFKLNSSNQKLKHNIDFINGKAVGRSTQATVSRREGKLEIVGWIADQGATFEPKLCFLTIEKDGRLYYHRSLDRVVRNDVGETLKVENTHVFAFHSKFDISGCFDAGQADVFILALGLHKDRHKIRVCNIRLDD